MNKNELKHQYMKPNRKYHSSNWYSSYGGRVERDHSGSTDHSSQPDSSDSSLDKDYTDPSLLGMFRVLYHRCRQQPLLFVMEVATVVLMFAAFYATMWLGAALDLL